MINNSDIAINKKWIIVWLLQLLPYGKIPAECWLTV